MAEEYGLANLLSGQPLPTDTSELGQIVGGGEAPPPAPSSVSTLPPGYRMMRLPNGASVPVYKDYSDADAMALIREQHPELFERPKPAPKPIPRGHAAAQEDTDPTFKQGQRYPALSTQDVIDSALLAENQPDLAAPEEIPLAYKFAPTAEQRAQIQKAKQAEAQPRDPEKQGFIRAAGAGLAREVGSLGRFVSESAEPFAPGFAQTVKGLTRPVEQRAETIHQPISDIELAEAKQKGMLPYAQAQLSRAGEVLGGFAGEWGLPSAVATAGVPGRALSTGMTFGQLYGDLSRRAEEAGVKLSLPEKYAGAALSTAIFQLAPNFITKGLPLNIIAPSARDIATIYEREGLEAAQKAIGSLAGNIAKSYATGTVGATGAMVGTEAVTRKMLGQPMPTFQEAAEMAKDAAIISGPMSILHGRAATKEQRGAYLDAATREFRQNAQTRQRAAEIQAENEARVWPEMRTGTARDQAPPTTERISAEAVPPTPPPIQEEAAPTDLSALPSEDIEVNLTKLKEQSNAFMDANDFDSYDLTQTAIEQHEAELRRREAEGLAAGEPPKEEAAPVPYYEQLGLSPKNKTVLNALKELDINNQEHHATIAQVLDAAINNPRLKVKDVDAMTALRDQLQPPEVPDAQQITQAGAPDGSGSAQPVFREEGGDQAVGGAGMEPSGQGEQAPEVSGEEVKVPEEKVIPQNPREAWEALRSEADPEHKTLVPEAQKLWREAFDEGAADQSLFNSLKTQVPTKAERRTGVTEEEVPDTAEEASDKDEFLYSKKAKEEQPWWYSPVARVLEGAKVKKQTGAQWKNWLAGQEGVKPDELEHSGMNDYLGLIGDMPIEKGELQHFMDTNGVKLRETERQDFSLPDEPEERHAMLMQDPAYAKLHDMREYVRDAIRQGEKELEAMHREYAAEDTTPARRTELKAQRDEAIEHLRQGSRLEDELTARLNSAEEDIILNLPPSARFKQHTFKGGKDYRELLIQLPQKDGEGVKFVQSAHFNEPNVLTFVRGNTRDNGKTFFVEEVQSDWGQQGQKRGFLEKGEALPRDKKVIQQDIDALHAERDAAFEEWSEAITAENDRHAAADAAIRNKIRSDMPTEERLALNERRMEEFQRTSAAKEALHAAYDAKIDPIDARLAELRTERRAAIYETQKVPSAPFVGSAEKWTAQALKKIIQHAVSAGHERVTFINGRQSAMRWRQRKLASRLVYDAEGTLRAYAPDGELIYEKPVKEENLPAVLGKESAERLLAQEPELGVRTSTRPTYVGGEGLMRHYDQTIPKVLNKVLNGLLKGTGAKIELERIEQPDVSDVEGQGDTQLSFKITPELREAVEKGIPLFAKKEAKGALHTAESLKEELGKLYGKNVPEIEVSTRAKEGVDEDVQGFFDPKTKRAVLIADNIEKGDDIHGLLRHEVAVHLKKLGATDAEFQGFLRQIEALRDQGAKDVVEAFKRVPKGTKAEDVTHEALAYLSQHKPNLPIVRRFMSWLRRNTYDLTGNAKWLKGDDFAVMADDVLSGKRTAKAEAPTEMMESRGREEPRKGAVFTTFDRRSVSKTIGNAISRVLKAAFDPTAMGEEYAKIRRQLVAESAGLTKALESMPTYNPETGIRVDYLRNQYDSAYQMAQEGVFNGIPVLNTDTGLARIQNSPRFNLDNIVADAGKVPLNKNFFGEKAEPIEVMSDIFRIKMGEQELKEIAEARSKLARMERLPAETRKQDDVREAMQDLRTLIKNFEAGEGRERLVKDEHIMWANQLIARHPEVQDIFDRWMGVNSALVKFAKDAKWISSDQAEIWDERPYVPLLKSLEALAEEKGGMPSYPGGGPKATGKIFGKKGSLQDVNIFENLVRHYAYMMGNSMMNNVKYRAFKQLERLGLAERVAPNYKGKDAVKFKDAGKDMLFKVKDEEAFRSLTMANMASIPLIELAAIPSNWLRTHSLVNPLYWERTFFREPVTANFVTTAKGLLGPVTPLDAGYEIGKILLGLSKEGKELKSYGVSGYATSQGMYDRFAKGVANTPKARKWTELMGHIHTSFDEGTRALIYKSAKKEAAKDGITDPEVINDIAAVKAREFADFAAKGSSQTVRQFAKLTPFFHAQLVGMDKMLRSATGAGLSGKEKERLRNRFISNAVIMSSAAMTYALVNMQDNRYRDLPIREWAHNFIAGFDEEGHGLKIPIPQELGFFFKFLPELAMRSIMGLTDAPEAKKAFSQMFSETVVPPGLLDPTTVALRGYLQLQTNKELHSELPIDSPQEMLGLPEDRDKRATLFGKSAVEYMKKAGIENFSPNQFDSFMRSMFSVNYELAAMSAAMIWDAYDGKRGLFELPFNKDITERYPGARGLFTNPRNISATPRFYDMARPLYQTMYSINRAYEGEGDDSAERLKELTSDSTMMMRYSMAKVATKYRTKISELEKAIEKLDKRKDISEAEKRRLYWARIKDRNELARKGLEEISLGMANDKKFKQDMDRPDTEHIEVTTDMLMREIGRFESNRGEEE